MVEKMAEEAMMLAAQVRPGQDLEASSGSLVPRWCWLAGLENTDNLAVVATKQLAQHGSCSWREQLATYGWDSWQTWFGIGWAILVEQTWEKYETVF